jgi:hypothetical protein
LELREAMDALQAVVPRQVEHHETITITQHANPSLNGVAIQVAGNARIGDDTKRRPSRWALAETENIS